MVGPEIATWLQENLTSLLSFPVDNELIQYIMKIENERDIDDYLRTLLDFNNSSHRQFCENYKLIRNLNYEKSQESERGFFAEKDTNAEKLLPMLASLSLKNEKKKYHEGSKKGKKGKFVNLYSAEGAGRDVILLKGRHRCDCQAVKHRLVNNCLSCGRIVCAQEGSGPCFFCGKLVCSKEEQEFINAKTTQSQKLFDNLMEAGRQSDYEEAVARRDRLVEYDRTTERRTRVIDDEGEYFSVGSVWLSPTERERLSKKEEAERERKHASRLHSKFTLDFAGRQVVEDNVDFEEGHEDEDQCYYDNTTDNTVYEVHPDLSTQLQPSYNPSSKLPRTSNKLHSSQRIQDKELAEMTDFGACLSLHQPWASLLVHGIMRHEGRTWYSAHRGRLWIAAASKPPSETEIMETEQFFQTLRSGEELMFPKHYPISTLLGCVTIVDCLPQEEYQWRYQVRESESPFVFICEDAHVLSLKFPIKGKHKIYKLDGKLHSAAQKALLRTMRKEQNPSAKLL